MNVLERSDNLSARAEKKGVEPVDIGDFVVQQCQIPRGPDNRYVSQVELIESLHGEEAKLYGKALFDTHQKHRHPFWFGEVDPLQYEPKIASVRVIEMRDKATVRVNARYIHENKYFKVPIVLKEKIIVMEDVTGKVYLFINHDNGLEPSEEMYKSISTRKTMDPDRTIHSLLETYVHAAEYHGGRDQKMFETYIKAHARVAKKYGVQLDTESILHAFKDGYYGGRNKMHNYLSGVTLTDGEGALSPEGQAVLSLVIARIQKRVTGVSAESMHAKLLEQCSTRQGVFDILRYNIWPINGEQVEPIKLQLAQVLVSQYLHPELTVTTYNNAVLPRLEGRDLSMFLFQLVSQTDTHTRDGKEFLISLDSTLFHQRALIGLLQNIHLFGFENSSQILELFSNIPLKKAEKMRFLRDLSLALESAKLEEKDSVNMSSYESDSWLNLAGQKKFIADVSGNVSLSTNELKESASNLLGKKLPVWVARLLHPSNAKSWKIPRLPENGQSESDYESRKTVWDTWLLYNCKFPSYLSDPAKVTAPFVEMRRFFHVPFWLRQIDPVGAKGIDSYIGWSLKTIREHAHLAPIREWENAKESAGRTAAAEAQRHISISKYGEQTLFHGIGSEINTALKSVQFALQMEQFYAHMREIGYPVSPSISPGRVFHLSREHVPYHLVAEHADRFQELKGRIAYGFIERRGSEAEHLGSRIKEIMLHPDDDVECSDYVYPKHGRGEPVNVTWRMSAETKKHILSWAKLYAGSIPETNDYMYTVEKRIGGKYFTWSRKAIESHWSKFLSSKSFDEKMRQLDKAIEYATALHEVNKADLSHFAAYGALDQSDHLAAYLSEVKELFTKDHIVPFGDLRIREKHPIILRGENMAGKSSVMRSVLYAALLQNQGLPQTGTAEIPFGLFADTPIGSERQGVDKSLLSSAISGLHRIAGIGDFEDAAQSYVWAIDEMGRRTNKHFGESLFLTSLLLASMKGNGANFVVSATHYHNLDRFTPLLKALGITPQWYSVKNHRLHKMKSGDKTESLALASLARYVPFLDLLTWPDTADVYRVQSEEVKHVDSDNTISRGRVEEITYTDLFGSGRRSMEHSVGDLLGGADDKTVFVFDRIFLKNIDGGKTAQKLFKNLIDSSFASYDATFEKVSLLQNFYNPEGERLSVMDFREAERNLYESIFGIDSQLSSKAWTIRAKAALKRLNTAYSRAVNTLNKSLDLAGFDGFSTKGMKREISVSSLSDTSGGHDWKYQIAFAKGVIAYTKRISGTLVQFHPVTYLDTPKVSMKDAFNPYLPATKVVPNDVEIDFTGETAGTFISGENYSGKSNYIRTVALALWLARTTGYAPAAEIKMHPNILPLSLTQPVSDEIGASSMAVESRDRLRPAYVAANGVLGAYIVTLLDEPGAPTSPEDAGKSIRWLFRKYWQNHNNAKLIVTSHCDDVPLLLQQEEIPVELSAFRLLSKDSRFKKIPGTVDSNALEVAKELGLHPLIYDFSVLIHSYIKAVDSGSVSDTIVNDYASKLMEILEAIEHIPRNAKWAR